MVCLDELISKGKRLGIDLVSSKNEEEKCGDELYLLLKKEKEIVKECIFSANNSCILTVSFANLLSKYLEGENISKARNIIDNCKKMVEGEDFDFKELKDLSFFKKIENFENRKSCISIVIHAFEKFL